MSPPALGGCCCGSRRLGPDARWYPYLQDDDGEWWPAAPADSDPVTALTAVWSQNGE
ncbi:hypothetical protein ACIHFE_26140 [Streptomyces sp. NPDC052396]|uniref:hypothetical protein n=1 Tax=Streptomyces sp. NPDC052396 TaxID=3365689 RepID=UPI0037D3F9C2